MNFHENPNSILAQISSECGYSDNILVRDLESVNNLIRRIVHGGAANLQVITDFDFTLSKHHTNELNCSPAADIIRQSRFMSEDFKFRARKRYDKLLPIELDTTLSIAQKLPAVIQSFQEGFEDLVNTKVVTRTKLAEMIATVDESCNFQLRDNCTETFQCLVDAQVPVLIFSAGLGDLIQGILRKHSLEHPNIQVIANFMEFDEKNEELIGFKEPLIHTYNKNESVIPPDCKYLNQLTDRGNVILLGDSIGDAGMAQGVEKPGIVLKIGFLNEVDEKHLALFLDTFDIVLMDDQSMDFVNCLLKKICM